MPLTEPVKPESGENEVKELMMGGDDDVCWRSQIGKGSWLGLASSKDSKASKGLGRYRHQQWSMHDLCFAWCSMHGTLGIGLIQPPPAMINARLVFCMMPDDAWCLMLDASTGSKIDSNAGFPLPVQRSYISQQCWRPLPVARSYISSQCWRPEIFAFSTIDLAGTLSISALLVVVTSSKICARTSGIFARPSHGRSRRRSPRQGPETRYQDVIYRHKIGG